MELLRSGKLDSGSSSFWARSPFPPPPTYAARTSCVPFLCLRVCQSSGTLSRSGQNAAKRMLGIGGPSGSGLLQPAVFFSVEGIGDVSSYDQLSEFEGICHPYQIQDGNSLFCDGVNKGTSCSQSTSRMPTSGYSFVWTLDLIFRSLGGKVCQFKALCFGLSEALQIFTRVFALVS